MQKRHHPRGSQEVGEESKGPVEKMEWPRGPWAWPGFCEDHPSSALRVSARPLSCKHWPSTCRLGHSDQTLKHFSLPSGFTSGNSCFR